MAQPVISDTKAPHTLVEDALAILTGAFVISFGVMLLRQAGTLTGGTAGLAFLLHYAWDVRFGTAFFLLNAPFFVLALRRMGPAFTVKTICAIGLVSLFTELHPHFIEIARIEPLYATAIGSIAMGLGLLVLFRHRASLGGFNILALYLQERHGIRAGKVQMGLDFAILAASLFVVSLPLVAISIVGAFMLNLIIAMNHRPNRYLA
ncbi:MAG: YitT family protein [Corticimicrobacter sp.]|uniref:YitT family protein n=1 Tax=Corticimicrobacter sp. TaxID=2678536 RepID=UPI0032DBE518